MRIRITALAALAALCVALPARAQQAPTEIQWWHSMGGALGEWVNDLAKEFNASQKDYKVVPTFKGSYDQSMTAAIAAFRAGNAPHILQVFEVGTATITDSREAESQYDLILAEEISADNEVRVRRLALELLVGRPTNELKPLARPVALPALVPAEPEPWVQIALGNNPTVQQSRLALEIAKLGTQKAYAGHKPTLDLTASYGNNRYPGGNSSTGFYTRTTAGTVGLAFNLPVFSGFLVENQVKEDRKSVV